MILAIFALIPGAFVLLSLGQTIADLPSRISDYFREREDRKKRLEMSQVLERLERET